MLVEQHEHSRSVLETVVADADAQDLNTVTALMDCEVVIADAQTHIGRLVEHDGT